jgi:uncharacterized repeat protein (TIGR02543 family)
MNGSFAPEKYTDSLYKFADAFFFHDAVWINESAYRFPNNMKIRFRCNTSMNWDVVYIDQIYINATKAEPLLYKTRQNFTIAGQYNYSIWCKDINGNVNISALYHFNVISNYNTLTVSIDGEGSVLKNPYLQYYPYGTLVQLTANPTPGWSFYNWTGGAAGSSPVTTVTMNGNKKVTAHFTHNMKTLNTNTDTVEGELVTVIADPNPPDYNIKSSD